MPKVQMVTTAKHCYEGKWLNTGDPFEANSQEDADDLRLVGMAQPTKPAPAPAAKSAEQYETRHMEAATAGTESASAAVREKRSYGRRDLKAQ